MFLEESWTLKKCKFDLSFARSTTLSSKTYQIPLKPGEHLPHLPKFVYLKVIIHSHSHEEAALKKYIRGFFFCIFVALSLEFQLSDKIQNRIRSW